MEKIVDGFNFPSLYDCMTFSISVQMYKIENKIQEYFVYLQLSIERNCRYGANDLRTKPLFSWLESFFSAVGRGVTVMVYLKVKSPLLLATFV